MLIQEEMNNAINREIDQTLKKGKEKIVVDVEKAKSVARLLTELSIEPGEADSLVNQYIAGIKNICNSK